MDKPVSLSSQLTTAHPWMKSEQAHGLIALKMAQLQETDSYGLITYKLDDYISLIKAADEDYVRDQISIGEEGFIPQR